MARNTPVQKISCNLNMGPPFHSSLALLALLLILIIQLCHWRLISPSYQRTPFHILSVILMLPFLS